MLAIAEEIIQKLRQRGETLSVAESCTGGMLGATIVNISGASEVFQGGVISYSNEVKIKVLGVPKEIIEARGAVSSECAAAMAEGAKKLVGADYSCSITGVAGPGGGTKDKPVGTVWFGVSSPKKTITRKFLFSGDRLSIRMQAVETAEKLILDSID